MPEFTVWVTVHSKAFCQIEAESEEAAITEAKDRFNKRQLDYYEEKVGSIEVDQEG